MRTSLSRRGCDPPPASLFALVLVLSASAVAGPASEPGTRPFAPGVEIDWLRREIRIDATVVLERGPLEFLACFPGKEHESIVRFEAAAEHIYQAAGLIGLAPGRSSTRPAAEEPGDLVELEFEYGRGAETRRESARQWLRSAEYGRPPVVLHFVFQGSTVLPDRTLTAGRTGEGVAVVDFPEALIGVTRRASSRTDELWLEANSDRIPPVGSRVSVVLRPARPTTPCVRLDFRGVVRVDGAPAGAGDLADLLLAERRLNPALRLSITVAGALDADVEQLRATLIGCGVPADAFELTR